MTPSRELSAVEELHRHVAEQIASRLDLVARYGEVAKAVDTSDEFWRPGPVERELNAVVEELHRLIAGHVSSEAGHIASYRELAEAPDTPEEVRYLIRVVVEDEERHHRFFREMTAAFGDDITPAHYEPVAVPDLPDGPPSRVLKEATARFLAAERVDQKQLRVLRKKLGPFRDSNLWALLVELMELDTAKHIHLLKYLRDHIDQLSKI